MYDRRSIYPISMMYSNGPKDDEEYKAMTRGVFGVWFALS
jgi:hypothetical protein